MPSSSFAMEGAAALGTSGTGWPAGPMVTSWHPAGAILLTRCGERPEGWVALCLVPGGMGRVSSG